MARLTREHIEEFGRDLELRCLDLYEIVLFYGCIVAKCTLCSKLRYMYRLDNYIPCLDPDCLGVARSIDRVYLSAYAEV